MIKISQELVNSQSSFDLLLNINSHTLEFYEKTIYSIHENNPHLIELLFKVGILLDREFVRGMLYMYLIIQEQEIKELEEMIK